ncbi:13400_t:CDS:1, partial [Ambispora leptoticha]
MASASGLQRRRNAGGLNSSGSSSNDTYLSATNSNSNSNGITTNTIDRSIISDNGVKIAVDPKDSLDDQDRKQPKLTLMEEVLLLGLKDKQ